MLKAAMLMAPINSINFAKDTSLALLLAAQAKGWELDYIEKQDLWVENGVAGANSSPIKVHDHAENWFELGTQRKKQLKEYDIIFMRLDPPVDNDYIYATQILEMAQKEGVKVTNSPHALRSFNEKIFATHFPQLMPEHLLSANLQDLARFHAQNEATVFKPLDAMGGKGILLLKKGDLNLKSVLEGLTEKGNHPIMAQRYIPEILKGGDKRVVLFYGKPYPKMLIRIPQENDFRANLAAGGNYLVKDLGEEEAKIVEQVAPSMKDNGLDFVGLDIIGGYLSEINITCPTGLRELASNGKEPASFFINKTEETL